MQITDTWQVIATASGALVQKHGSQPISIAYHATAPVDNSFGLNHNQPLVLPAVAGKNIYAKTVSGTVEISVEAA